MTIALVLAAAAGPALADAPLALEFEAGDTAGWTCTAGALTITAEAADVSEGNGALQCAYTAQAGAPLGIDLVDLEVAGARSLTMSVKTSAQAPIVLSLAEADGSSYHTFVTTVANEWCHIKLPLADIQLQDGSTDENDALDADQITSLSIQELTNMGGEMSSIFGQKTGEQTFHIDAVRFGVQDVPSRGKTGPGKIVVDEFAGGALHLLAVGQSRITHVPGAEGQGPGAVGIKFRFSANGALAWPGAVVPLGHVDLSRATALRLRLKPAAPLGLHVLLEEWDGSRYESECQVETGGEWAARDMKLADFTPDPARNDENDALDLDQLRVVVIVADVFNALLDDKAEASLVLDDILFLTE